MGRNKMTKAPQFKRIEGMVTWLYRLGLEPLFEFGLPVFVGGRKELEPVAVHPLWIACLVSSILCILWNVDANNNFFR